MPLYEIARGIKARRGDPLTPVIVREAASEPMATYLSEHAADFPGVSGSARTYVRHYPYHSLAAQLLGYIGEISASQLKSEAALGYKPGDEIGEGGVESAYDRYLRGVAGTARLHVDARNRPRGSVITTTLAEAGPHAAAHARPRASSRRRRKRSQHGIALAQANGQWAARGGAIVALDPTRRLDPRDGVLSLVRPVGVRGPRVDAGAREPGTDRQDRARRRTSPR